MSRRPPPQPPAPTRWRRRCAVTAARRDVVPACPLVVDENVLESHVACSSAIYTDIRMQDGTVCTQRRVSGEDAGSLLVSKVLHNSPFFAILEYSARVQCPLWSFIILSEKEVFPRRKKTLYGRLFFYCGSDPIVRDICLRNVGKVDSFVNGGAIEQRKRIVSCTGGLEERANRNET